MITVCLSNGTTHQIPEHFSLEDMFAELAQGGLMPTTAPGVYIRLEHVASIVEQT